MIDDWLVVETLNTCPQTIFLFSLNTVFDHTLILEVWLDEMFSIMNDKSRIHTSGKNSINGWNIH